MKLKRGAYGSVKASSSGEEDPNRPLSSTATEGLGLLSNNSEGSVSTGIARQVGGGGCLVSILAVEIQLQVSVR